MPKQKPTPEQITRAVKATMRILDQSTAHNLADVLKTYGNVNVENMTTSRELALFELNLRVIFNAGANILMRKLYAELQKPVGDYEQSTRISTPTGALQSVR